MSTKPLLSLEVFSDLARNTVEGSPTVLAHVARHMTALRDCGTLQPIEGLDAYRINFVSQWNAWISGDDSPACIKEALYPFLDFAEQLLISAHFLTEDGRSCEKPYAYFVDAFETGLIHPFHLNAELYSFETGETARLRMEQWQPRLFRPNFDDVNFSTGTGSARHIDLEPISPAPILEQKILLTTGHMLAADWFRLPGFTETLDSEEDFDISSTQGREMQTLHYLSRRGVVSVCVGNTSPSVFLHENCLVVGEASDYDAPPSLARAGQVTTDYWWVTLIEREQLAALIAPPNQLSYEAACAMVDAYVADSSNNVVEITLEPGEHHLYFKGDHRAFTKHFAADEVSFPGVDPFFVLSGKPLTLKDTDSPKAPRARM